MNWERLLEGLRRANAAVATAVGVLLALTALFILVDVTLRQFGRSLGGSDEIAGYVMAIAASWGLGYALVELAHVRIDLVHRRLPGGGRACLDLAAIAALALVVALIAYQCWPVLGKSLAGGSRANTPLETPLWIPQSLWFGGWLWFAASAWLMLAAALGLLLQRRREPFDRWFAALDESASLGGAEPSSSHGAEPSSSHGSEPSSSQGTRERDDAADGGGGPGSDRP